MKKNFISNKDETVRLFENNLLEKLSRVHWTVPIWIFSPIIFFFFYRAIFLFGLSLKIILLWFLVGIFVWTFTEYFLHRFVFHYQPKSELGNRLHFLMHGVHHAYPKDSKRLVMPPAVSLPLATLFFIFYLKILGNVIVAPFFAGFLTGYLFYDITHYAIHHFNFRNKLLLALKNHHAKHHYQNPELGFGVSQPTWDYVFGTDFKIKN
ncbi:MAG: sterol desaturase family protein [Melioribacteraceae bacterium]|nr:sterol desaturase family protein [Melioribacteraceae bacterium]